MSHEKNQRYELWIEGKSLQQSPDIVAKAFDIAINTAAVDWARRDADRN